MREKPAYKGKLAEPFNFRWPRRPNPLFGEEAMTAYRQKVRDVQAVIDIERAERWRLLREHYNIDPECSWQDVADMLAVAHVPGMRFAPPPEVGRKAYWSSEQKRNLRRAIDELVATGLTVEKACQAVKQKNGYTASPATLRTVYYSGRKRTELGAR